MTKRTFRADKRSDTGRWAGRAWDARRNAGSGGWVTAGSHKSKAEALRAAKELWLTLERGVRYETRSERSSVRSIAEAWLKANRGEWAPASYVRYERDVRGLILPSFAERAVSEVLASEVLEWKAERLAEGRAPRSVHYATQTFAALMDSADFDGLLPRGNPVRVALRAGKRMRQTSRIATKAAKAEASRPAMSDGTYHGIVRATRPLYRIGHVLMHEVGLRPSEAFGLTLDRVDFVAGTVRVDRQWAPLGDDGRREGFAEPKHGSERVVPVSAATLAAISAHVKAHGLGTEGTILHRINGGPMRAPAWSEIWRVATTKAAGGVRPAKGTADYWTPRHLRHAFGSIQLNAGHPPATVAAWMGHADTQTLLAVYAHEVEAGRRAMATEAAVHGENSERARNVHGEASKRHLKAV